MPDVRPAPSAAAAASGGASASKTTKDKPTSGGGACCGGRRGRATAEALRLPLRQGPDGRLVATDPASIARDALFGPDLLGKAGPVETAVALNGKAHVCILFAGRFSSTCRNLVPKLARWYEARAADGAGRAMEVVFASSDHDAESFKSFCAAMPWLALPFGGGGGGGGGAVAAAAAALAAAGSDGSGGDQVLDRGRQPCAVDSLMGRYGIELPDLPVLAVVDQHGELVTAEGVHGLAR